MAERERPSEDEEIVEGETTVESQSEEESLPELELRQISRSPEAINEVEGRKESVEVFEPWHDYTLVTLSNNEEIRLFDKDGKPAVGFTAPANEKKDIVSWRDLNKAIGVEYEYIVKKVSSGSIYRKEYSATELPSHWRELAEKELKGFTRFLMSGVRKREISGFNYSSITEDGEYIVLVNKSNDYIAFDTKNQGGADQLPRNWKRYDMRSSDLQERPEGLRRATNHATPYVSESI